MPVSLAGARLMAAPEIWWTRTEVGDRLQDVALRDGRVSFVARSAVASAALFSEWIGLEPSGSTEIGEPHARSGCRQESAVWWIDRDFEQPGCSVPGPVTVRLTVRDAVVGKTRETRADEGAQLGGRIGGLNPGTTLRHSTHRLFDDLSQSGDHTTR